MSSLIASIHIIFMNYPFFDFLNLHKFLTILLALLLLFLITLLLLALNVFKINSLDNSIILNIRLNGTAILLKSWMKRQ